MPRKAFEPGDLLPDPGESPFAEALAAGDLSPLTAAEVPRLVRQIESHIALDDVALELAALRLVLFRLLTEHHDLPSLATLVARVVTVSLHAARTSHQVRKESANDVLDAINAILAELAGPH